MRAKSYLGYKVAPPIQKQESSLYKLLYIMSVLTLVVNPSAVGWSQRDAYLTRQRRLQVRRK